jgi:hypothetical protein
MLVSYLLLVALNSSFKTRFRIVEDNGVAWFARPNGEKFISMGVCCVDQGASIKSFNRSNPSYSATQYYLSPAEWASATTDRLLSWGFNTVGAWSDADALTNPRHPDLLFTPILHIGSSAGAPWKDMWDPKTVAMMDSVAGSQIKRFASEPRVLGYFSDNELGWWYGAMFEWAFRAGPASREHFLTVLNHQYGGDWERVLKDFEAVGAGSFDDLKTHGRLFLRPGGHGYKTIQAWMRVVSERYYSLCKQIITKYDPGALYLGDRYISSFYPEVAQSAAKYCDVVSTNLNADTPNGLFAPFYLPALRSVTKRPILISEYYEAATDNRSGNKNNSSGFPVVRNQAERAKAFVQQTSSLVQTPYVVGAHWFQYYDEPTHGRPDGENYDMGLVDISNRPYVELDRASKALSAQLLHQLSRFQSATQQAIGEIPTGSIRDINSWIAHGAVVPAKGPNLRGDLYLARSGQDLYAAVYWNEDLFSEALYRNGKVPPTEDPRLVILINGVPTQLALSASSSVTLPVVAKKFGVRNYVILKLPFNPASIHLSASLVTRCGAYRLWWANDYLAQTSYGTR